MDLARTAELSGYGRHRNIDQRSRDDPFIFAYTDSTIRIAGRNGYYCAKHNEETNFLCVSDDATAS